MRVVATLVLAVAAAATVLAADDNDVLLEKQYRKCHKTTNCFGYQKDEDPQECLKDEDCDMLITIDKVDPSAKEATIEVFVEDSSAEYAAVGFSKSKSMAEAFVLSCSNDRVMITWNKEDNRESNEVEDGALETDEDDIEFSMSEGVLRCVYTLKGVDSYKIKDSDDDEEFTLSLTSETYYVLGKEEEGRFQGRACAWGEMDGDAMQKHEDDERFVTEEKYDLTMLMLPPEYEECFKTRNCYGMADNEEDDKCMDKCVKAGNCKVLVSLEEDDDDIVVRLTGLGLDEDQGYMAVGLTESEEGVNNTFLMACTSDNVQSFWIQGTSVGAHIDSLETTDWNVDDNKKKFDCEFTISGNDLDIELESTNIDGLEDITWDLSKKMMNVILSYGMHKEDEDDELEKRTKDLMATKEPVLVAKKRSANDAACSGAAGVAASVAIVALALAAAFRHH